MNTTSIIACAAVGVLVGTLAFAAPEIMADYKEKKEMAAWMKQSGEEHKKLMDRLTFKTFESRVELCAAKLRIGVHC